MEVVYTDRAEQELKEWIKSGNKQIRKKIIELIRSIVETPSEGVGKPEQLKHDRTGYWSRRITDEHRLVYKIEGNKIIITQLKFHY